MVARRLALPVTVSLVAVAVAVALIAVALRESSSGPETERESLVRSTVRASFDPEVHAFGEPVNARLELLVRQAEIDLSTLRPIANLDPYGIVGTPRREIFDFGALYLIRYTITIQCLKQACLPETQTGNFEFGPTDARTGSAAFTWRTPPPPGRRFQDRRLDNRSANGDWPPLKVVSRLSPAQLDDAAWRSNLADLPEASFRVAPRWLAAGLVGAAAALVLLAAALVGRFVADARRRTAAEHTAAEVDEPPLAQALALLDDSRVNGDDAERRIALDTLARELVVHGEPELARHAERLAWSPSHPEGAEVDELADAVRRVNGGSA